MKTEVMIKELELLRNKESGKIYHTFSTNWLGVLNDVIDKILDLKDRNSQLEQSQETLKAIELAWENNERLKLADIGWIIEEGYEGEFQLLLDWHANQLEQEGK